MGDDKRGALLEGALVKLLLACRAPVTVSSVAAGAGAGVDVRLGYAKPPPLVVPPAVQVQLPSVCLMTAHAHMLLPQLIAMSATMPNVAQLAAWLGNASLFVASHRPVPLAERVAVRF